MSPSESPSHVRPTPVEPRTVALSFVIRTGSPHAAGPHCWDARVALLVTDETIPARRCAGLTDAHGVADFHPVAERPVIAIIVDETVDARIAVLITQPARTRVIPTLATQRFVAGLGPVAVQAVVTQRIAGDFVAGVSAFVARIHRASYAVAAINGRTAPASQVNARFLSVAVQLIVAVVIVLAFLGHTGVGFLIAHLPRTRGGTNLTATKVVASLGAVAVQSVVAVSICGAVARRARPAAVDPLLILVLDPVITSRDRYALEHGDVEVVQTGFDDRRTLEI